MCRGPGFINRFSVWQPDEDLCLRIPRRSHCCLVLLTRLLTVDSLVRGYAWPTNDALLVIYNPPVSINWICSRAFLGISASSGFLAYGVVVYSAWTLPSVLTWLKTKWTCLYCFSSDYAWSPPSPLIVAQLSIAQGSVSPLFAFCLTHYHTGWLLLTLLPVHGFQEEKLFCIDQDYKRTGQPGSTYALCCRKESFM